MSKNPGWAAARVAVCLGALGLVVAGVDLDDHVRLASGEVLIGEVLEDSAGLRVLRPGQPPRRVASSEIALDEDGAPEVRLGLRTVWRTSRGDWLALAVLQPPNPELFETWAEYIGAAASCLLPQLRGALRTEALRVSQAVANASGGFFRLGNRVSASEQKALDRIEAAFETE